MTLRQSNVYTRLTNDAHFFISASSWMPHNAGQLIVTNTVQAGRFLSRHREVGCKGAKCSLAR